MNYFFSPSFSSPLFYLQQYLLSIFILHHNLSLALHSFFNSLVGSFQSLFSSLNKSTELQQNAHISYSCTLDSLSCYDLAAELFKQHNSSYILHLWFTYCNSGIHEWDDAILKHSFETYQWMTVPSIDEDSIESFWCFSNPWLILSAPYKSREIVELALDRIQVFRAFGEDRGKQLFDSIMLSEILPYDFLYLTNHRFISRIVNHTSISLRLTSGGELSWSWSISTSSNSFPF